VLASKLRLMPAAPIPPNDPERVKCLEAYSILDSARDQVFDDVVKLSSQICGTPIALVTLVDRSRQWFLAQCGLKVHETPREHAFCGYTILGSEILLVENAALDPRFVDNPLVLGDPHIRFYAGAPLRTESGMNLGSLCVIDSQPRQLTQEQLESLKNLANIVMSLIQSRQVSDQLAAALTRVDEQEMQIKESEQRFEAVFQCQNQLVGIVTPDGTVEQANQAAVLASGASQGTYVGRPFWDLPFWRHDPAIRARVREFLEVAKAGQVAKFETTYKTKGNIRWGQFSLAPFFDEDGRLLFLVAEGHDVDELKQAQGALVEQNSQLEKLNSQKNLLLGMAAHDLRNPLSAVLGYSKFITNRAQEGVPEKVLGFVRSIEKSANSMLALVDDLLDVSTFESGKLTLKTKTFDLRQLLEDVSELNQPLAEAKQITVIMHLPESPLMVCADPVKINQVLTNLVTNAIKYSERNRDISLSLTLGEGLAKFCVKDAGPGISSEEQALLFKPFGRLSRVHTTGGESSTGLGLAIARRIIEGHNGQIGVLSEPGQGATFWFTLPLPASS
jgi:PAS domain S-box-containing protein